jgi:hypothetical protein
MVTGNLSITNNQSTMAKRKLSKKQKAVLEDLFSGELSQQEVLAKHKVKTTLYNQWLTDENFAEAFDRRIANAYRQSQLIIATYAPLAAAKLVSLTNSEKDETARKACLDIIAQIANGKSLTDATAISDQQLAISDQTASKLLAALAED